MQQMRSDGDVDAHKIPGRIGYVCTFLYFFLFPCRSPRAPCAVSPARYPHRRKMLGRRKEELVSLYSF